MKSLVWIESASVVAWAVFGAMISVCTSLFIPNRGRIYGVMGGMVGGAVGAVGLIFATVCAVDLVGRLIVMALVGGAFGFAIGLVEAASQSAWFQVAFGAWVRAESFRWIRNLSTSAVTRVAVQSGRTALRPWPCDFASPALSG